MSDWLDPQHAIMYLGLEGDDALEQLEAIVHEYDIEVELDTHGELVEVEHEGLKEALFHRHEKHVGHRPDDPKAIEDEKKRAARREKDRAARRKQRRHMLEKRVLERR